MFALDPAVIYLCSHILSDAIMPVTLSRKIKHWRAHTHVSLCRHPCTCLSIRAHAFPFVPFHLCTCLYLLHPCLRICMHRQLFVGVLLLLCVCTLTLVLAGMRTYTCAGIQAFACIIACAYTLLHDRIFSSAITGSCAYMCTCSSMRSLAFACMLIIYGYLDSHIID